jgi:hypothetical protein
MSIRDDNIPRFSISSQSAALEEPVIVKACTRHAQAAQDIRH